MRLVELDPWSQVVTRSSPGCLPVPSTCALPPALRFRARPASPGPKQSTDGGQVQAPPETTGNAFKPSDTDLRSYKTVRPATGKVKDKKLLFQSPRSPYGKKSERK